MSSAAMSSAAMSSWSELIKSRERSNKELAWKPGEQEAVKYVTRYEVSRKERAFDPVLQRFSDPQREDGLCKQEKEERVQFLNRRKVQQLDKGSHFNVINHEAVLPGVREAEARRQSASQAALGAKRKQSRAGYNIISNIDLADHNYVAPEQRPDRIEERTRVQSFVEKRSSHPDFDVISNRYKDAHEAKVAVDLEAQKRRAAQRFWETRDFDPVKCTFYDTQKERKFHERRVEMEGTHGSDFAKRLPPTLRASDGLRYDIVSMQPRSNQGQDASSTSAANPRETGAQGMRSVTERAQQESGVIQSRLKETRRTNRCTPERHSQVHSYEHGYDIVNTRPFVGRSGIAKPAVPGSSRNKTLWDRLEEQRQAASE